MYSASLLNILIMVHTFHVKSKLKIGLLDFTNTKPRDPPF